MTRDPLGLWGDPSQMGNAYSFVGASAINGRDPYGLWSFVIKEGKFYAVAEPGDSWETLRQHLASMTGEAIPEDTWRGISSGQSGAVAPGESVLVSGIGDRREWSAFLDMRIADEADRGSKSRTQESKGRRSSAAGGLRGAAEEAGSTEQGSDLQASIKYLEGFKERFSCLPEEYKSGVFAIVDAYLDVYRFHAAVKERQERVRELERRTWGSVPEDQRTPERMAEAMRRIDFVSRWLAKMSQWSQECESFGSSQIEIAPPEGAPWHMPEDFRSLGDAALNGLDRYLDEYEKNLGR